MATRVYLGLGSNLGDRLALMREAVRHLRESGIGTDWACSALYETAPVGPGAQGDYYNAAVGFSTEVGPRAVLETALAVERAMGRVRGERWASRNIDIDLLLFGDAAVRENGLVVPHPWLMERNFVLRPLCDLDASLAVDGRPLRERLRELGDGGLRRIAEPGWESTA